MARELKLPGISVKFDPVSAGKIWNYVVAQERRHIESPRSHWTGCQRLRCTDESGSTSNFIRNNTYVCLDPSDGTQVIPAISLAASKSEVAVPVSTEAAAITDMKQERKREWFDKYHFFSRPVKVGQQACQHFQGYRMKHLYPLHASALDDPLLVSEQEYLSQRQRDFESSKGKRLTFRSVNDHYLDTCDRALLELKRSRSMSGMGSSGYKLNKYKYFSTGSNYPSSGMIDRFISVQEQYLTPKEGSFLKKTREIPGVSPSILKLKISDMKKSH